MKIGDTIKDKAIAILALEEKGLRFSVLMRKIKEAIPSANPNTINGNTWNLDSVAPDKVYKPARGIFRHIKFKDTELETDIKDSETHVIVEGKEVEESSFYETFASWIVTDLEECTKAISLGGNAFRDKWGTPDVIGILTSMPSDIVKLPPEIISAEIKLDSSQLITAFGQACSYTLFSHKVYIVIPKSSSEGDISRLDALCRIFGIGLVLFDTQNPKDPQYDIRVRAIRHEPDIFYVNKNLKLVETELFG